MGRYTGRRGICDNPVYKCSDWFFQCCLSCSDMSTLMSSALWERISDSVFLSSSTYVRRRIRYANALHALLAIGSNLSVHSWYVLLKFCLLILTYSASGFSMKSRDLFLMFSQLRSTHLHLFQCIFQLQQKNKGLPPSGCIVNLSQPFLCF